MSKIGEAMSKAQGNAGTGEANTQTGDQNGNDGNVREAETK
jgi:hypothetical protein